MIALVHDEEGNAGYAVEIAFSATSSAREDKNISDVWVTHMAPESFYYILSNRSLDDDIDINNKSHLGNKFSTSHESLGFHIRNNATPEHYKIIQKKHEA